MKFWIVGTPDGPEEIYEGEVRPKMLYEGGPYNHCSVAYETLESLQATCGMIERCRECNGLINHHWIEPTRSRLIEKKLCFCCDHWTKLLSAAIDFKRVIVNGGRHYMIEPELPARDRSFGGFGGARHVIAFLDGRTVTSHNLWHQGTIPERFRNRLPDNACFTRASGGDSRCGPADSCRYGSLRDDLARYEEERVSDAIDGLDDLSIRLTRLSDYAAVRATCPCCTESRRCLPDCTFATDSPSGHAVMRDARYALFGEENT